MADVQTILDKIGKIIVERADSYQKMHSTPKQRALEIYFAFVGQFLDNEAPQEDWQSKLYAKMLKPKIMAAWSQYVQAAMSAKNMWNVSPRGMDTPGPSNAAKAMASEMMEQAEACQMFKKLKSGSIDMFMYGTLFWQAPIVETQSRRVWKIDTGQPGDDIYTRLAKMKRMMFGQGQWVPVFSNKDFPSCIHRNYFEMFPWPYSSDPQQGEAIIHRPFIDNYEMANLKNLPGFYKDTIEEIMKVGPGAAPSWSTEASRMGARGFSEDNKRKGYDLIFHAGRLSTEDLKELPEFEKETGKYVEVLAHVVNHQLGQKVINLTTNPLVGQHRPFMSAHYEQMPFESSGIGIGENSVDIAKSIGGAIRLFLDGKKMALPMLGINSSYFSGSTEIGIEPFKVWPFDGAKGVKPSDFMFPIQFNDITNGMVAFIEVLERLHDEVTGIPKWTTGVDSKMLNKTATGISMIMNASSQLIRGAIENLDDCIIGPTGERFYDWNMQHNTRKDIKGDFIITPAGISSLMQKETMAQQLLGLMSLVINPAVMQNEYAMRLLRMVGDNMGIKDVDAIVPDPDKLKEFAEQSPAAAAKGLGVSEPRVPTVPEMMRDAQLRGTMKGVERRAERQITDGGGMPPEGTA